MANWRLLLDVQHVIRESQCDCEDLGCLANFIAGLMDVHVGNEEIVWMTFAIAESCRVAEDCGRHTRGQGGSGRMEEEKEEGGVGSRTAQTGYCDDNFDMSYLYMKLRSCRWMPLPKSQVLSSRTVCSAGISSRSDMNTRL